MFTGLIILLISLKSFSSQTKYLGCTFPNKDELSYIESCASQNKYGKLKIKSDVLKKIQFDKNQLAGGSISSKGCYWLKQTGEMKKTYCYDNGSDYFTEGLSRYLDDRGRFGYMNEKLKVKIPAQFTFAFPFENGTAKICMGCKFVKSNSSEHTSVTGGVWKIINKSGRTLKKCKNESEYSNCTINKRG